MKFKLTLALIAAACCAVTVSTQASIVVSPSITYTFTADPSAQNTDFDGSTLTINAYGVQSYSLFDRAMYTGPVTGTLVAYEDITSYSESGWTGNLDIFASDPAYYFGATGDSLYLYDDTFTADPQGIWAAVSTPDAASNLMLLTATAGGLMIASQMRSRKLAAVRA